MGLIFNLDMDASPVSFSSCIMRNCSACAQVMSFSPFYSFENVCVLPLIMLFVLFVFSLRLFPCVPIAIASKTHPIHTG